MVEKMTALIDLTSRVLNKQKVQGQAERAGSIGGSPMQPDQSGAYRHLEALDRALEDSVAESRILKKEKDELEMKLEV